MTSEEGRESLEVFREVWELPTAERGAFLDARCAGRPHVRERVARLLAESDRAVELLTGDVFRMVRAPAQSDDRRPADRPDTPLPSGVPDQIGPYRTTRLIGTGGMGAVYEAQQDGTGRRVALKLIRAAAVSPEAIRRIRREARLLGRLRHPGVAQIHEAGVCRLGGVRQPFLAMEYIEGQPLTEFVRAKGLTLAQRLELLARVCDAVEHAHQRGVIHRDLKPANVLVEPAPPAPAGAPGQTGQPRIIDFGVAALLSAEDPDATSHTGAGQLLGTLPYMSPEQIAAAADPAARADVDTRSDVYSLGVMLYEIVTGRLPFPCTGGMLEAVESARTGAPAPRARQFAPALPADVEAIAAKALEREPARRYQSAADLARDLRRHLARQPVLARPLTTAYVLTRFLQRNRRRVALIGIVSAAAIASVVLAFVKVRDARHQAEEQYRIAADTADFLVNDVITALEDITGASEVNRRIIERILARSEDLLARYGNDQRLLRNHAVLLGTVASMEEERGRNADALPYVVRALEIRERLAAMDPGDPAQRMELSIAMVRAGNVRQQLGETEAAGALYRAALKIDEALASEHPDSRRYRDNLGHSYERVAAFVGDSDPAACESLLLERLRVADALLADFPDSPESLVSACSAHTQLCWILLAGGRLAEAQPHADAARSFADRLSENSPDRRTRSRYAFAAYNAAARCAMDRGDPAAAKDLYTAALRVAERQALDDPRAVWPVGAALSTHRCIVSAAEACGDADAAQRSRIAAEQMMATGKVPQENGAGR